MREILRDIPYGTVVISIFLSIGVYQIALSKKPEIATELLLLMVLVSSIGIAYSFLKNSTDNG